MTEKGKELKALALVALVLAWGSQSSWAVDQTFTGIALVKPFAWSPDTDISDAIAYSSFEDHTGYYILIHPNGEREHVDSGEIVQMFEPRGLNAFSNITSEQELQSVSDELARIQSVSGKVDKAKTLLTPIATALQSEIASYRNGNKKVGGQWISDAAFTQMQAMKAAAEANAEAERLKAEAEQAATQERDDLKSTLASDEDLAKAEAIIANLEKLKGVDSGADETLREWKQDQDSTLKWKAEAKAFFDGLKGNQTPPLFRTFGGISDFENLPPDAQRAVDKLRSDFEALNRSMNFPQLLRNAQPEDRDISSLENVGSVVTKIGQSDIPGALDVINAVLHEYTSPEDSFVATTFSEMKKPLDKIVNDADSHKAKGQELEALGKTEEAIKEYKESYDLLKDDALLLKMKSLREQSLGL